MKSIKYFSATVQTPDGMSEPELEQAFYKMNRDWHSEGGSAFKIQHYERLNGCDDEDPDVWFECRDVWTITGSVDRRLVAYQEGMSQLIEDYWKQVREFLEMSLRRLKLDVRHIRVADGLDPWSNVEDITGTCLSEGVSYERR